MAKLTGIKEWILEVYHSYIADFTTRLLVFYGGAGSGKSTFAVQKCIIKCFNSKRKLLVVRKVQATMPESVWAEFLDYLRPFSNYVRSVNKSTMKITLTNGSEIIFKGMDNPEKIKSIKGITDIFIEEATELTLDDFNQLNLRLRSKAGNDQIIIAFNPISKANWVYKYFFEEKQDNCKILHTNYEDNPHLPESYVKEMERLKEVNPTYYKIYALGEFATLDKLVFPNIEIRLLNQSDLKQFEFWVGMDFGFVNDATAITWGFYDATNLTLYITGEYNRKGMTNDVIAQVIKDLGFRKEWIIADSAEEKSIAEIKKLDIPRIQSAIKGPGSVNLGIDRMQRMKIIVDERCVHTIEEFENYSWKKDKKTNEYTNEPIDAFNHHMDSIRYGIQRVVKNLKGWQL